MRSATITTAVVVWWPVTRATARHAVTSVRRAIVRHAATLGG